MASSQLRICPTVLTLKHNQNRTWKLEFSGGSKCNTATKNLPPIDWLASSCVNAFGNEPPRLRIDGITFCDTVASASLDCVVDSRPDVRLARSARGIANEHRAVLAGGGQVAAVGRERHGRDGIDMAGQLAQLRARGQIPDLRRR